jgi:hypothetical protein
MARYDPSDPEAVKKRKSKAELRRQFERDDLKAMLALKEGRRFIARLLGNAGLYRDLFALNSLEIARNAATHDWCRWIIEDLNRCEPGIVYTLGREFSEDADA